MVVAGDFNDKAEVALNHVGLGFSVSGFDVACECELFFGSKEGVAGDFAEIELESCFGVFLFEHSLYHEWSCPRCFWVFVDSQCGCLILKVLSVTVAWG